MSEGCRIDGCENPVRVKSRRLCRAHYLRWVKHGDPTRQPYAHAANRYGRCAAPGCDRAPWAKGLCQRDYARRRRTGSAEVVRNLVGVPMEDRFWMKVRIGPGCWEWQAAVNYKGYGHFTGSRLGTPLAHRIAYLLVVGLIPEGRVLDHLCRNRRCVNPDHLEPVTNEENIRRAFDPLNPELVNN